MCEVVFEDKKKRRILLKLDEFNHEVEAFYNQNLIGSFLFDEVVDHFDQVVGLLVVNMHLENIKGFTRCGIGSKIISWVEEYYGLQVAFGSDDGTRSDDGSHLTGDGPAFAAAILSKRI